MKKLTLVLLLVVAALPAAAAEDEPTLDYRTLMLRNALLPGTAQLALGQTAEGVLYLASLPLQLAGLGIVAWQTLTVGSDLELGWHPSDGKTYLLREEDPSRTPEDQWLGFAGLTLSLYGNLLSAYSNWAAERTWADRYGVPGGGEPVRHGRESLARLLAAPWIPANVLNPDTLIALGITAGGSLSGGDFARVGEYFRRTTVPFLGLEVTPAQGLALRAATALVFVTANAVSEEILFRGVMLEQSGVTASSLSFGLAHLPNALMPGVALEDTVLQTVFALGFGFYAARATVDRGYNFERMVALHYWNNVLAFVLGYLTDPESQNGLTIGWRMAL